MPKISLLNNKMGVSLSVTLEIVDGRSMVYPHAPQALSDPDGEDGHAAHTSEGEPRARALAQARGRRGVGEPVVTVGFGCQGSGSVSVSD